MKTKLEKMKAIFATQPPLPVAENSEAVQSVPDGSTEPSKVQPKTQPPEIHPSAAPTAAPDTGLSNNSLPADMSAPIVQPSRAGRMKNQIQKPATVHRLKQSGKWAVLVTLVEPRELEGKMRSGRQKFERQTQALANDLCVEINNCLFGKELARQLSPREVDAAKKLFWELLEPKHPDWIENLDKLVGFCERAQFRIEHKRIPTVAEAARIYWFEHVAGLESETRYNTRWAIAFLLPAFGHLQPAEMTDQAVLDLAHGKELLPFMRTSGQPGQTKEEADASLWDTLVTSGSKRPWSNSTLRNFLTRARAFKNWMHASKDPVSQTVRNWCPTSTIVAPRLDEIARIKNQQAAGSKNAVDWECQQKPALTIPQIQALIDVAWVAWGGKYAPFYVHGLWCGSRAKEIRRTSTESFDSKDGVLFVPAAAAKTDKGRESQLHDNAIIMVEALRQSGLYTGEGLKPNPNQRAAIHILAGFNSNCKYAISLAKTIRQQLLRQGIVLPEYNWGSRFPANSLRRTALSMHYKLFQNVYSTTGWGGNSPGIFKEYYKRLVTKDDARQFWLMLPTWLTKDSVIEVTLPTGHKLDSAMTPSVTCGVSTAGVAMEKLQTEMSQARVDWNRKRKQKNMNNYKKRLSAQQAADMTAADSLSME
jgi:hypothetical protein